MKPDTRLNVLLITIDALRADFVGCYKKDGKPSPTPNLDRFANEAVVFQKAFAPGPHSRASFPALFTSAYSCTVVSHDGMLLSSRPTLAEVLKSEGYRTAAFHSNPFLSMAFGYGRGFDIFDDGLIPRKFTLLPQRTHLLLSRLFRLYRMEPYLAAARMNRKVETCLRRNTARLQPFFLWVHYMDPHGPYQSKEGFAYVNKIRAEWLWHKAIRNPDGITPDELATLIRTYGEEIAYTDRYLGSLLKTVRELSLLTNTLVVICSDHGEEFYEHGKFSHPRQLYDELIRVPLILKHPRMPGREVSKLVSLMDVVPTILHIIGSAWDKEEFEGHSLLPLMETGSDERLPEHVISDAAPDRQENVICLRTSQWKFIIDEMNGQRELYDLQGDPEEKINLIDKKPELAKQLESRLLGTYLKAKGDTRVDDFEDGQFSEEVLWRLKGLGYIDWVDEREK